MVFMNEQVVHDHHRDIKKQQQRRQCLIEEDKETDMNSNKKSINPHGMLNKQYGILRHYSWIFANPLFFSAPGSPLIFAQCKSHELGPLDGDISDSEVGIVG